MKKVLQLSVIFLLSLLSGCIPSLHPLYTADTTVFVGDLIGSWAEEGIRQIGPDREKAPVQADTTKLPEMWSFGRDKDKRYRLIHRDSEGDLAAFEIHLVKLGEHMFMDFYPAA
ncbi:MAG: hypothetical protein R3350_07755, partial [Saprospiraceae bacterium]|nr:hypothetical protein [Saprospiraceae bacterium]